jgi:hypothetical protein
MVICTIPAENFTKGLAPKEVFALLLDERAFSVWSVTPSIGDGALLFQTHALCRARPEVSAFTVMVSDLPNIALTGLLDWQQAQTLMVNTYNKLNPLNRTNIPFKGVVYPADLMVKTTQLEKEVAQQRLALAENAQRIQELTEEKARSAALATQQSSDTVAVREAEDEASRAYAAVYTKQQRIEELEFSMEENRRLLAAANDACSSREARLHEETRQRLEDMQRELNAVRAEKDRLQTDNEQRRHLWGGGRAQAGGGGAPLGMTPEVLALFTQQAEALKQTAQAQADAQRQNAQTFEAMMKLIVNMGQGAGAAAPPIITVVPTQTDAKKTALQRVQAILQLFDQDKRTLAWRVTEVDHANVPLSYDMDWATERVRKIIAERGGRAGTQPSKSSLSNISLLLFDYAGEGLSLEDFTENKSQKIGERFDRFTSAYLHMSYVLREYVSESLGGALDSLMMNLLHIHAKYPRMKTSSLMYTTQQLLGKLRTMEPMPDRPSMIAEVTAALKLEEGSQIFQTLLNQEFMGIDVGDKRSHQQDSSPQPTKRAKGVTSSPRPTLQGAYPCYAWIKDRDPCKGPVCNAPKRKGVHPHKFDPADRGAPEKAFRDWVLTNT